MKDRLTRTLLNEVQQAVDARVNQENTLYIEMYMPIFGSFNREDYFPWALMEEVWHVLDSYFD